MKCFTAISALIIAILFWASPADAQIVGQPTSPPATSTARPDTEQLTLSGSLRVRYEMLEGQYRPGLLPRDDALLIQTSLVGDYRSGGLHLIAEMLDSRAYLADAPGALTTAEVNTLELTRASIGYVAGPVEVAAGRFHLNLGSFRLTGRRIFPNAIDSFTGLRFDWSGKAGQHVTAFYALPHVRQPMKRAQLLDNDWQWDRESTAFAFWGAHYAGPVLFDGIALQANGFGLTERDGAHGPTRNRHLFTWGARLFRPPAAGRWDIDMEGAVQTGNIRQSLAANAPVQDVRAFLAHAEIGYSPRMAGHPRISALLDIASGDDPRTPTYTRFDPLFGPRRFELGPPSLFGPLTRSNLLAGGLRLEMAPAPRWDLLALWRPTWVHSRRDKFGNTGLVDPNGRSGRFAGHMVELRLGHWLIPQRVRLEAGAAIMTSGSLLATAPNATGFGDTRYAYGQVHWNF